MAVSELHASEADAGGSANDEKWDELEALLLETPWSSPDAAPCKASAEAIVLHLSELLSQ